jgi:uncharacterized membrane protein YfcA
MGDLLTSEIALAVLMAFASALYTTVGHAGASAYLALMALFGVAPQTMRPTALVLNIVVSSFTMARFWHAGLFRWRTLWPFLIGAIPLGFVGGAIVLPTQLYRPLVGIILFIAAARFLRPQLFPKSPDVHDPPIVPGIVSGAGIGLLSGLTGTGGGIFLSPLLLCMGWSETRIASGVAAVFIWCISIAGLAGNLSSVQSLPSVLPLYMGAVMIGAVIGTSLGTSRLSADAILKALGFVLVIAGFKLVGVY